MKKSTRNSFFTLGALLIVTAFPGLLSSQTKMSKTDALTKDAEVIVVGKVGKIASSWADGKSRIETRVSVSVDETIKGSTPGNSITVVVPGGEVDGVGEWYSHSPRFGQDEDVVLFAKKDDGGHFRVAGGESGKVTIRRDQKTGAKMIPNEGSLDEFKTKIRKSVKSTDGGSIKN